MNGRWQRFKFRMSIVGPPLLLIVIGAAVYITVVKLSQPQLQTIEAVPQETTSSATPLTTQSSAGAQLSTIQTSVSAVSSGQVAEWQVKADSGAESWRFDPLQTAKQMAGQYGFETSDQFSRQGTNTNPAVVVAIHHNQRYAMTLTQPGKTGAKGVWVITSIVAE